MVETSDPRFSALEEAVHGHNNEYQENVFRTHLSYTHYSLITGDINYGMNKLFKLYFSEINTASLMNYII
jgi:hypothetical protein